ncbi:phosphatase 2C-like domain-containing protein [Pelagophyceae sp. CCMP2097]|nr:phosphatase 2C-like domain-containing protein [Pelagophyceae sp. CCMP2097]
MSIEAGSGARTRRPAAGSTALGGLQGFGARERNVLVRGAEAADLPAARRDAVRHRGCLARTAQRTAQGLHQMRRKYLVWNSPCEDQQPTGGLRAPGDDAQCLSALVESGPAVWQWVTRGCGKPGGCEDRAVSVDGVGYALVAAIDGHGGDACAAFLKATLPALVERALGRVEAAFLAAARDAETASPRGARDRSALVLALRLAEARWVALLRQGHKTADARSGACVTVALIRRDWVTVANLGDCGALIIPIDAAELPTLLSVAHRCSENAAERARVSAAGGAVDGEGRVVCQRRGRRCTIEPCRTIGDSDLKDALGNDILSAVPHARAFRLGAGHDTLVLASDGVHDVLDASTIAALLRASRRPDLDNPARLLVQEAKRVGSLDDAAAIVVDLRSWDADR